MASSATRNRRTDNGWINRRSGVATGLPRGSSDHLPRRGVARRRAPRQQGDWSRVVTLKAPRSVTCRGHGQTAWRSNVAKGIPYSTPQCGITGCTGFVKARGWCGKHYQRWWLTGTTDSSRTPEQRFWPRVDKNGPLHPTLGRCWVWTGDTSSSGYGRFYLLGRQMASHVVSWWWANGPVPEGLELDHLCRVRACCNPEHLEPVTHRENIMRSASPPATNARKTHCVHGHEFTVTNTYITSQGYRSCRTCHRDRERERYRLLREATQ